MTELENGCTNNDAKKDATAPQPSEKFGLDAILVRIGQFGKFQMRTCLLIILPLIFNAILMCSYIFFASSLVQRCRVPECDTPQSAYQEPWTSFSIPLTASGELDECYRYVPYNRNNTDLCTPDNYDPNSKEECGTDFIFRDNEVTISNDFDIYCSDIWKLSMVGTVNVAGQFVGSPLGGYFSDNYGRRNYIAIGGFLSAVLGLLRSVSPNYYVFLILGFLENVCSGVMFATLFVIGVELFGQKGRVLVGSILPMFYSVGAIVLAIVAKNVHNWRWILRVLYTPSLAHIALLWILPESLRWLLSRGEEDKAAEMLRQAAKANKRKLSDVTIQKLILENRYKLAEDNKSTEFPIKEALRMFPGRILNCALCWFSNAFVYHGLNLNSVLLGGNKFDSFMFLSMVEIPAYVILYLTINRFGRRFSLFGYLLICGICLGATTFVSKDSYALQLTMFLIGKMAITISFQVTYFFTSEIFPTNIRNSLLSLCSMCGRVGSMVAPQTILFAKFYESAPAMLFSGFAFLSAFMALLFPETTNVVLPSTLNEAKGVGQKKPEEK